MTTNVKYRLSYDLEQVKRSFEQDNTFYEQIKGSFEQDKTSSAWLSRDFSTSTPPQRLGQAKGQPHVFGTTWSWSIFQLVRSSYRLNRTFGASKRVWKAHWKSSICFQTRKKTLSSPLPHSTSPKAVRLSRGSCRRASYGQQHVILKCPLWGRIFPMLHQFVIAMVALWCLLFSGPILASKMST